MKHFKELSEQEKIAALDELTERCEAMSEALALLKRGDCWCEMAIGHPLLKNHSKGCVIAQNLDAHIKLRKDLLAEFHQRGDEIESLKGQLVWMLGMISDTRDVIRMAVAAGHPYENDPKAGLFFVGFRFMRRFATEKLDVLHSFCCSGIREHNSDEGTLQEKLTTVEEKLESAEQLLKKRLDLTHTLQEKLNHFGADLLRAQMQAVNLRNENDALTVDLERAVRALEFANSPEGKLVHFDDLIKQLRRTVEIKRAMVKPTDHPPV